MKDVVECGDFVEGWLLSKEVDVCPSTTLGSFNFDAFVDVSVIGGIFVPFGSNEDVEVSFTIFEDEAEEGAGFLRSEEDKFSGSAFLFLA